MRLLAAALLVAASLSTQAQTVPTTSATALDHHTVQLPRDLAPATVFVLVFTRKAGDALPAWEKPIRQQLIHTPQSTFFDVAVLASVPGFMHGFIERGLLKQVPPVVHPNFFPAYKDEAAWKTFAAYDPQAPDATYIVLTDRAGHPIFRTHAPYTEQGLHELAKAMQQVH